MTMLHQLQSGDIARIVAFEPSSEITKTLGSKGIMEGSIIRIISRYGLITLSVHPKIFSVSDGIAKNIRVIKIRERNVKGEEL